MKATYFFSPGEQNGNEPEILASILDEFILELSHTHTDTQEIHTELFKATGSVILRHFIVTVVQNLTRTHTKNIYILYGS